MLEGLGEGQGEELDPSETHRNELVAHVEECFEEVLCHFGGPVGQFEIVVHVENVLHYVVEPFRKFGVDLNILSFSTVLAAVSLTLPGLFISAVAAAAVVHWHFLKDDLVSLVVTVLVALETNHACFLHAALKAFDNCMTYHVLVSPFMKTWAQMALGGSSPSQHSRS